MGFPSFNQSLNLGYRCLIRLRNRVNSQHNCVCVCVCWGGGSYQFWIVGSSYLHGLKVASLSAFDGSTKILMHELEVYFIVNMKEK